MKRPLTISELSNSLWMNSTSLSRWMFRPEYKLFRSVSVELLALNHKNMLSYFTQHRKLIHGLVPLCQCMVLSGFLAWNYNSLFPGGRKRLKIEIFINQIGKVSSVWMGNFFMAEIVIPSCTEAFLLRKLLITEITLDHMTQSCIIIFKYEIFLYL